ncbi:MAG: hypothetical protein KAI43_05700 [Candidatus Aureabacteria bacterium]|nr:hypothetical protein [Candidatus Auribacterota bacterium]
MNSEKVVLKYLKELHKYDTTAFLGYNTLKENLKDTKVIDILSEIAQEEKKHIAILDSLIKKVEESAS